jgi:hypothetical protein
MIFGEKIETKVYLNLHDFIADIQTHSRSFIKLSRPAWDWLFKLKAAASLIPG